MPYVVFMLGSTIFTASGNGKHQAYLGRNIGGTSSGANSNYSMFVPLLSTSPRADLGFSEVYNSNYNYGYRSDDSKTIYWYNTESASSGSGQYQFNYGNNSIYYYLAIGT